MTDTARRRLHLRIAAGTGIPFAVLWGGWFVFANPVRDAPGLVVVIVVAAVAGLLFGAAMSAILGSQQWRAVGSARVRANEAVRVDAPLAEVLRRSVDAVSALDRADVASVTSSATTVTMRVGMSLLSWGEWVQVDAAPDGEATLVTVSSRPAFPLTLVDYGRNARNVRQIVDRLSSE